jgi:hypothetical protein
LLFRCLKPIFYIVDDFISGRKLMILRYVFMAFLLILVVSNSVSAHQGCAVNSIGQVICAPPGGGAAVNSIGQVVIGRGGCAVNAIGQVICADTAGGGAATNSIGQVKTGPGECVTNSIGQVMCSSQPGGGAAVNGIGQAVCAGGCVTGR